MNSGHEIFYKNDTYRGKFYAGNRLRSFPSPENATLIQGKIRFLNRKWSFSPESGKHFQDSGISAVDSSYKIPPIGIILEKISGPKFMKSNFELDLVSRARKVQ